MLYSPKNKLKGKCKMKTPFKKALAIILACVMVAALSVTGVLADTAAGSELPDATWTTAPHQMTIGQKWHFGSNRDTAFTAQGQNGFYAMYSTKVNQGNSFPVKTAKLCVLDTADNYFKISDGLDGYKEHFKIASSDAGASEVFTKAVHLATGYSAVIAWKAPRNGQYLINQQWRTDSNGCFTANNDGVAVGIYTEAEAIYYHDQQENIASWENPIETFERKSTDGLVTLAEGEVIYFVSDPKNEGYTSADLRQYDAPWTQIDIEYRGNHRTDIGEATATYSSTEIGTTYSFGNRGSNFKAQGNEGFYAMYSFDVNKGNSFPLDELYYCSYDATNKVFKINTWQNEYVSNFLIGSQNLESANTRGQISLATGYSAVIKFKAPVAGEYSIDAKWRGNGNGRFTWGNEGVSVGIYSDYENLYYFNTDSDNFTPWSDEDKIPKYASNNTISLEAGECIYFVADPKVIGCGGQYNYDTPWFQYIDIKLESGIKGDVNTDGKISLLDLVRLEKLHANSTASENSCADVNKDNIFDSIDIAVLIQLILKKS